MALFDFIGGLFGQQEAAPPPSLMSPSDVFGQITAAAPEAAAANVAFNKGIAVPYANLQKEVESIYDPNQAKLRQATTSSILEQLGLGGKLPEDVQQQVIQNALQGNVASGFGVSPGGRGLVARDLGLTSLDLLNQRIGRAADYTRSAPRPGDLFQPATAVDPSMAADIALGNQNATNQYNTYASQVKNANNAAIGNTLGSILGFATGGGGLPGLINMFKKPAQNSFPAATPVSLGLF